MPRGKLSNTNNLEWVVQIKELNRKGKV
jgi:hypothetical protein